MKYNPLQPSYASPSRNASDEQGKAADGRD